jgi:ABC-type transport system involved in multi-copper enzyme maturation permease subunit
MVTGSHGVRMQWDFTHDVAGLAGTVSATSPRWLRLSRSGDTITGYDSADGTHWTRVGAATLAGLPSTTHAGLFAASPGYSVNTTSLGGGSSKGGPSLATGTFDQVSRQGAWPAARWTGQDIQGTRDMALPASAQGFTQAGDRLTVAGSGDIAPATDNTDSVKKTLAGTFAGLIAVTVIGVMFITAEYRRGLIRTTLAASPRRGRVLAAKAIVIGAVSYPAGLVAAAVVVIFGKGILRANGVYVHPATALTQVRLVAGTAALLAVTAVLALAIGAILRRSAAAVSAAIVVIVLPYVLAMSILPAGAAQWLLRVTPAAAFAVQQAAARYPQVDSVYTPVEGYFPLAPWTGFAVLCAWAALALGVAAFLLRRRDA